MKRHRAAGKRIVFTNGCFDIIHLGHVKYFQWAKQQGDLLVVGVNTDAGIRKLKGEKRPIISEVDRLGVLEELQSIAARPGGCSRGLAAVSMANIHSQKKRILRTERERLENRQYTSAIKTHFRRLESLVQSGDDERRRHHAPRARAARSTRPSSAARCIATTARTRSHAPPACALAKS